MAEPDKNPPAPAAADSTADHATGDPAKDHLDALLEDALKDSFPASDPFSITVEPPQADPPVQGRKTP